MLPVSNPLKFLELVEHERERPSQKDLIMLFSTSNLSRLNPFVPNALFLYTLKTLKNRKVFWCFQEVEKGYLGTNGLEQIL